MDVPLSVPLIIITLFMLPAQVLAKREHPEKWYQERWCRERGGQIEVVLPDKTRCDCVTVTHAIEFDFGSNWAEAIDIRIFKLIDHSTIYLINESI